jgi:hypothetical protein
MLKPFFFCVMASLAMTSCQLFGIAVEFGNGVPFETTIEVSEFNALSVPSSLDVVYTQTSGEQSVTLVCDENLFEYYNIRVEDNTLIADTKRGVVNLTPRVRTILTVNSPVLNQVKLSGSGDCDVEGLLAAGESFLVKVSGSGDFHAHDRVTAKNFTATTSGSGNIGFTEVFAQAAEFKSSGSGSIGVDVLSAESIKATTTGSGDIHLTCKDAGYIEASTSGSGDIVLKGNALSVKSNSTGSGRVNAKNLSIGK